MDKAAKLKQVKVARSCCQGSVKVGISQDWNWNTSLISKNALLLFISNNLSPFYPQGSVLLIYTFVTPPNSHPFCKIRFPVPEKTNMH